MRWMLSHVVFVRGGDGALARTCVVALGCAGDGAVVWLGSSTHTRSAYMPSLVICAALCCLRRCGLGGAGGWSFFLCVFSGFPLYASCVFFWGGVAAFLPFLVCACGCEGRTMGCVEPYDFGRAGLPPCF